MQAKNLLQELSSKIATDAQVTESTAFVTSITGTSKDATVTVFWPVEGIIRVFEVSARELQPYVGLEAG